jgi:hypothetical protein
VVEGADFLHSGRRSRVRDLGAYLVADAEIRQLRHRCCPFPYQSSKSKLRTSWLERLLTCRGVPAPSSWRRISSSNLGIFSLYDFSRWA